jgi:hypothetical protein
MAVLARAVEVRDVVRALNEDYGLTQSAIARMANVSDRTVRSWLGSSGIRRDAEERVRQIRDIVLVLDESLTRKGVSQWFRARNRLLDGQRPIDLVAEGQVERVRAAAEAFADGAYV